MASDLPSFLGAHREEPLQIIGGISAERDERGGARNRADGRQLLRDYFGQMLMLAHANHGHDVPLACYGVHLRDLLDRQKRLRRLRNVATVYRTQDDRGDHGSSLRLRTTASAGDLRACFVL